MGLGVFSTLHPNFKAETILQSLCFSQQNEVNDCEDSKVAIICHPNADAKTQANCAIHCSLRANPNPRNKPQQCVCVWGMLSSTWNTYRNTFKRQNAGYLQSLVQDGTSSGRRKRVGATGGTLAAMTPSILASVDSPDSSSSSTTLQPFQDQYVSFEEAYRTDLSHSIGTAFSRVRLSALAPDQVKGLARIVAERGVIFFEGQDDFNSSEEDQFIEYLDSDITDSHGRTQKSNSSVTSAPVEHEWQSDYTHENQPPSLSIIRIKQSEEVPAETAWVSQYGVYDSLSSPMQRFVAELTAIHNSGRQTAEHPTVRTHPITKLRALDIVPDKVTTFPQLKKKESDKLVELLDYELHSAAEHTIRWKWKVGDVALWDNRCTAYRHVSAYFDPTSESRTERQLRIEKQEQEERDRIEEIKRRYNNTPLRRIIARQVSYETVLTQSACSQNVEKDEIPSPVDSVISNQDAEETIKLRTIVSSHDIQQKPGPLLKSNTPLRRILERQMSSSVLVQA